MYCVFPPFINVSYAATWWIISSLQSLFSVEGLPSSSANSLENTEPSHSCSVCSDSPSSSAFHRNHCSLSVQPLGGAVQVWISPTRRAFSKVGAEQMQKCLPPVRCVWEPFHFQLKRLLFLSPNIRFLSLEIVHLYVFKFPLRIVSPPHPPAKPQRAFPDSPHFWASFSSVSANSALNPTIPPTLSWSQPQIQR